MVKSRTAWNSRKVTHTLGGKSPQVCGFSVTVITELSDHSVILAKTAQQTIKVLYLNLTVSVVTDYSDTASHVRL